MPDWADQLLLRLAATPEGCQQARARAETEYQVLPAVITQAVKTQFRELLPADPPYPGAIPFRRGLWHEFNTALRIGLDAAPRIGDRAQCRLPCMAQGHQGTLLPRQCSRLAAVVPLAAMA
jgi:hypothetical protein